MASTKKFIQHVMTNVDILLLWQLLNVYGPWKFKDEQTADLVFDQCLYLPNSMPEIRTRIVSFHLFRQTVCLICKYGFDDKSFRLLIIDSHFI